MTNEDTWEGDVPKPGRVRGDQIRPGMVLRGRTVVAVEPRTNSRGVRLFRVLFAEGLPTLCYTTSCGSSVES